MGGSRRTASTTIVCGSSCYTSGAPGVIMIALLLTGLATSQGFSWHAPPSLHTGGRHGRREVYVRRSVAVKRLCASGASEGSHAATSAGAGATSTADVVVRPKVIKPWPTKAQETVDYRNVEAL